MKHQINAHPRAIAMLLAAAALPITPSFAQETTAPPAAAPAPVAPTPAIEPAAPPVAAVPPVFAPTAPVVQAIPVRPAPLPEPVVEAAPAATPRAAASRPTPRRQTPVTVAPSAAPAPAVTPLPATTEADAAQAPAPSAVATPPAATPEPSAQPVATEDTQTDDSIPWTLIGGLALAAIALGFLFARRRGTRGVEETTYVAPYSDSETQQTIAPVRSEPSAPVAPVLVPTLTRMSQTPAAMVEPQPIAPQPVSPVTSIGERPWIGLSLAPICAGVTDDGTMVQYELIVENTGEVPAQDVRVTSFMIDGANSKPMEQALINPLGEAQSQTVDIVAGGSVPITTTIHVNRSDLSGDAFMPKIVAEARYPLPGGGEGHFAARFVMGIADGDAIKPVGLRSGDGMHDDVGATFEDVLESI